MPAPVVRFGRFAARDSRAFNLPHFTAPTVLVDHDQLIHAEGSTAFFQYRQILVERRLTPLASA